MNNKEKMKDGILAGCTRYLGAALILVCGYLTGRFTVDYKKHSEIAGTLDLAHPLEMFKEHVEPLWHLCLRGVQAVAHCSARAAGALVSGIALAVAFLIAWHVIKRYAKGISALQVTALCLVLHLVAAIYVPWFNEHPYLGQGTPNVWHNPTLIMVRPISLLAFLITAGQLQKIADSDYEKNLSPLAGFFCALLLVLANLAKPSYAQVFYPGIFLLMLGWLAASKGRAWKHCLQFFFMCLPSVILMGFQLVFTFLRGSEEGTGAGGSGGIVISPLLAAGAYTDFILISILLLIAFPLFMALVTIVRRRFRQREILAWLMLFVGLAEKLLLAETGSRLNDGNFGWGYLNAAMILWFVSILEYAEAFLAARPVTLTAAAGTAGDTAILSASNTASESAGTIAAAVASEILSEAAGAGPAANTGAGPEATAGTPDGSGETATPAVSETDWTPEGSFADELPESGTIGLTFTESTPGLVFPAAEGERSMTTEPVPESVAEVAAAPEATPEPAAEVTAALEAMPEPIAEVAAVPEAMPEPAAEVTAAPEPTPEMTEEKPEAEAPKEKPSRLGSIKAFLIDLVRAVGLTIASVILAAHFVSGLYYLFYWLLFLRNTI